MDLSLFTNPNTITITPDNTRWIKTRFYDK